MSTSSPRREADERLDVLPSLPFFTVHALAFAGACLIGFHWWYVAVALASYYLRMFFVTAGYHRYFAHRAYKTSRWFQFVIAFMAETSAQKGVLWWAGHHRDHHKFSDQPDDIHSPRQKGLWWSHVGWILSKKHTVTKYERIKDFAQYPELRFIDKHYYIPTVLYGAALFAVGGWPLVIWGHLVSTVLLWHGTFTINSLSHVFGSVRYESNDDSKNNWLLALVTCGEGWHNNHHYYQSTANQGFFWWEVDASYYGLKLMSWLGLVWDLRKPPRHIRDGRRAPLVATPLVAAPAQSAVPAGAVADRLD